MFEITDILHIFLIFFPLLFALQLLTGKKSKTTPAKILGIMMVCVSLYYIVTAPFISPDNYFKKAVFSNFLFFLFLSINPFFFLYTKSLTSVDFRWRNKYLIHHVPALAILIWCTIAFNFFDPYSKDSSFFISRETIKFVSTIIYNFQVLGYSIGMFLLLKNHAKKIKQNFSYNNEINNLNWLKVLLVVFISFSIIDLLVYYLQLYSQWALYYYLMTNAFFVFIGYRGVNQPDIYLKAKELSVELIEDIVDVAANNEHDSEKKQLIASEKVDKLYERLKEVFDEMELYKNSELSIFDVSKILNVNKTYISYIINNQTGENFNYFVNQYRINETKKMLLSENFDNYTIEAIANIVGFHSKSSFNTAFKKIVKQTPSEFKKLNR